jgi:hypothetical protein
LIKDSESADQDGTCQGRRTLPIQLSAPGRKGVNATRIGIHHIQPILSRAGSSLTRNNCNKRTSWIRGCVILTMISGSMRSRWSLTVCGGWSAQLGLYTALIHRRMICSNSQTISFRIFGNVTKWRCPGGALILLNSRAKSASE